MNLEKYLKQALKNDPFLEIARELVMETSFRSCDLFDVSTSEYDRLPTMSDYSDWDMEQIVNRMELLQDLMWMDDDKRKFKKHTYVDSEDWEVAMYLTLNGASLFDWRAIKEVCSKYQSVPAWFPLDVLDQMTDIKEKRNPCKSDKEIENIAAHFLIQGFSYEDLEEQGRRNHNYSLADEYGENWSRILKAAKQMEQEEE